MPEEKPEKKKVCPECGEDLAGKNPKAHAAGHWDPNVADKDLGKDAAARRKILMEM